MKAILFLAVLVIAAQSNPINELYRGFVSSLPMDVQTKNSIMNDGLECLNSAQGVLMKLASTVQRDIKGENYLEAIRELLYTEEILEHKIAPVCFMTYARIARFFQENKSEPSFDYFNNPAEYQLYFAKMIQTVGRAVEDLAYLRGFDAGQKIANFLNMGFGLVKADLPEVEKLNYTMYVPFDQERFINEFISGLLKELGANEGQVNGCVTCTRILVNATQRALSNPALHGSEFFPGFTALLEGALMITDAASKCQKYVDFAPIQEIVGLFLRYPLQFYIRMNMNDILDKVAITQSTLNYRAHGQKGQYAQAGKELAKILKSELRGIVF